MKTFGLQGRDFTVIQTEEGMISRGLKVHKDSETDSIVGAYVYDTRSQKAYYIESWFPAASVIVNDNPEVIKEAK